MEDLTEPLTFIITEIEVFSDDTRAGRIISNDGKLYLFEPEMDVFNAEELRCIANKIEELYKE